MTGEQRSGRTLNRIGIISRRPPHPGECPGFFGARQQLPIPVSSQSERLRPNSKTLNDRIVRNPVGRLPTTTSLATGGYRYARPATERLSSSRSQPIVQLAKPRDRPGPTSRLRPRLANWRVSEVVPTNSHSASTPIWWSTKPAPGERGSPPFLAPLPGVQSRPPFLGLPAPPRPGVPFREAPAGRFLSLPGILNCEIARENGFGPAKSCPPSDGTFQRPWVTGRN